MAPKSPDAVAGVQAPATASLGRFGMEKPVGGGFEVLGVVGLEAVSEWFRRFWVFVRFPKICMDTTLQRTYEGDLLGGSFEQK